MKDCLSAFLRSIGEDPNREGLRKTPDRWEESMQFLTSGYSQDLVTLVRDALFNAETDELVLIKDIEFYSLCEHHLLPFFGRVHVGYLPDGKILGLSKIPRIINVFARRLQTQERLGRQIAEALKEVLHPKGLGIVIEARHLCMMMRGVEKQHTSVTTHHFTGVMKETASQRGEFLQAIHRKPQSEAL